MQPSPAASGLVCENPSEWGEAGTGGAPVIYLFILEGVLGRGHRKGSGSCDGKQARAGKDIRTSDSQANQTGLRCPGRLGTGQGDKSHQVDELKVCFALVCSSAITEYLRVGIDGRNVFLFLWRLKV